MELLIEAFLLGLVGGAVPGPILTGTFTEILSDGFIKGCRVIIWALIAETIGAIIALYVLYTLGLSKIVIQIISIGGALVLFWLASSVWRIREINIEAKQILSFPKIILLTALNSGYWIFWITVGIPKALSLDQILTDGKFLFLFFFELAWLIITFVLAFIFFKFRPLLQRKNLVGVTFKVLASVLILLGIKTLIGVF
ncbi:MAG: LysE family transporter [Candidatus Paceibacterota bacterium]|jgi:threonine/homoserine/homoserine lactone efflux protein